MKTLFVILDTLRRDYLTIYGNTWVHTPNITRLAERSVVFDNHWCGSLPCMPARREFMTGRHNFLERGWGPLEPFDDVLTVLLRQSQPRIFSHLITDHFHYFYLGGEGHNNSFDTWEFERGQAADRWVSRVDLPALPPAMGELQADPQLLLNRLRQQEEHEFSGPRCVQNTVRWLEDNGRSDNWFLQLELFDPHEPFYVIKKYLDLYDDRWDGPIYDSPDYGVVKDSPEATEHMRKAYAALLTMTDHWLGRVWDKFDELNLWDDTLVVLTTDHGTMLAEHQYWMKLYMPVYNEIARLPLIIHLPGSKKAGHRVKALTQSTDLMPTFLDYFDVPPPPHVHGTSLRPVLEGDRAIHDSIIYGYFGMAVNVTDGRYTYFRNPVEEHARIYAYTAMPSQHHGFIPRERLAEAEMGRFLCHTYNVPLYKIPLTGRAPLHNRRKDGAYEPFHELFDLAVDPTQDHPITDAALEAHYCELIRRNLQRVQAPPGHLERLGL